MKKRIALFLAFCLLFAALPTLAEDVQIGYVNTETKVYMDASDKAMVEGTASLGAQVRIEEETLADGVGWYRVTFLANEKTGWVLADDVDLVIAKKAIVPKQSEPAAALKNKLEGLLRNAAVFGVDLIDAGLADRVCENFSRLLTGPGAVRAALKAL